jgi:hypothetical protein
VGLLDVQNLSDEEKKNLLCLRLRKQDGLKIVCLHQQKMYCTCLDKMLWPLGETQGSFEDKFAYHYNLYTKYSILHLY